MLDEPPCIIVFISHPSCNYWIIQRSLGLQLIVKIRYGLECAMLQVSQKLFNT